MELASGITAYEVMGLNDGAHIEAIRQLRDEVWSKHFAGVCFKVNLFNAVDEQGIHWIIKNKDGRVVAAARLTTHRYLRDVPDIECFVDYYIGPPEGHYASINRLVVHPEFQGLGLGRYLDSLRIAKAKSLGCEIITALTFSGERRTTSLSKQGFFVLGPGRLCEHMHERGYNEAPMLLLNKLR